ncbi:MAG: hypothetical protein ACRDVP_02605 [Acidimicrobiales bacterium]
MRIPATSITLADLERGARTFAANEPRDAMYKVATKLIDGSWGSHEEVADALGVLLLTWNQAFYRYGPLDFDRVEQVVATHATTIERFRRTDLIFLSARDDGEVRRLFDAMLDACAITTRKARERRQSPVSAAKVLHMLAPASFPLWDNEIARSLGIATGWPAQAGERYLELMAWCRLVSQNINKSSPSPAITTLNEISSFPKPMLKYIDEYLYARFTMGWI